jgi:L-asparaginase
MRLVALGSLGGTITMTSTSRQSGVTPTAGADDLVAAVPGLDRVAEVHATTLGSVPSASLTFDDVLAALAWARGEVEAGAAGVVLVQGTDTLEETAFLLDLFWERPEPLVVTGAMRPPQHAGADGPANLLASVATAASPQMRDTGVLVVLNDEVHAAARVRKTDSTALDAFASPGTGPLARVVEREPVNLSGRARQPAMATPDPGSRVRVALLESSLDDRADLVRLLVSQGYDGLVLAAFGVGHVSDATAEAVSDVVPQVPVVVASRTGAGSTLTRTYGFTGSESDLLARGAVLSGWLDARKSRVLLWALLSLGHQGQTIREEFARRGCP